MRRLLEALLTERPEEIPDRPGKDPVLYCKTRTVRAGQLTEVEVYPVYVAEYRRSLSRTKPTARAMQLVNDEHAARRFRWMAEANFDQGKDYFLTLTYRDAPRDEDRCRKDLRNYIARVNRARKKIGLDGCRYLGVIQLGDKNGRLHHHLLIEGGLPRDQMEALWGMGFANCDRIQHDPDGLTPVCKYMTRGFRGGERAKGRHRYVYSRNLRKPRITESKTRISRRQAERIAEEADREGSSIILKKYPGLILRDLTVRKSEWLPGVYIRAMLYKGGG